MYSVSLSPLSHPYPIFQRAAVRVHLKCYERGLGFIFKP